MTTSELAIWYETIRQLPTARGCDARLSVFAPDVAERELGADTECDGWYTRSDNEIVIVQRFSDDHTLTTLLHETAHAVVPATRYRRPHGSTFRATYARLIEEFTRIGDAAGAAEVWRAEHGHRWTRTPMRWEALDMVATFAIQAMLRNRKPMAQDHRAVGCAELIIIDDPPGTLRIRDVGDRTIITMTGEHT